MSAAYEVWIREVFDHPESDPDWCWSEDFDDRWEALGLTAELMVEYLTRLFLEPGVLRGYTLGQMARAIWFLVGESSPGQPAHALIWPGAPLAQRVRGVRAIPSFFGKLVAPAAPGPVDTEADPFHMACYMWWDVFPSWGRAGCGEPEIHRACLEAMEEILTIPTDLCRISALHGLNHWHLNHPAEVHRIIDAFLQEGSGLSEKLREYAQVARTGCAQ